MSTESVSRRAVARSTRGFFGIGIYNTKTPANLGTLWRSAATYGADFIFTVSRRYERQHSDTLKAWKHTPLYHYSNIDDLIEHLPHLCPLVGVELDARAKPLAAYKHPERACYLLGAEDHGLPQEVIDRCHGLVVIEALQPWSLNVAVAGSLILHDRYVKRQSGNTTCEYVPNVTAGDA